MPSKVGLVSLFVVLTLCAAARANPAPGRPAPIYGPPPAQRMQFALAPFQRAPPPPPPPAYRPASMVVKNTRYQYQQPQMAPPRYRVELQGVWRYTAPIREMPLREDQVPFQGLGATESVTMPEAPPYDPLLVHGPGALRFVQTLSARGPYFFPDFPHTSLVLDNQQQRLNNGLQAHRLGSIRPGSDFIRLD